MANATASSSSPGSSTSKAGGRRFDDGSALEFDAVIWATGYRADYSWVTLPILVDDGRLRHHRGVTDVPGLYFLGLTWQYTRGSALIGFVKDDAALHRRADCCLQGVERGLRADRLAPRQLPSPPTET